MMTTTTMDGSDHVSVHDEGDDKSLSTLLNAVGSCSTDDDSVGSTPSTTSASTATSKRLSNKLSGLVSRFNSNPTDATFFSPMQSMKEPTVRSASISHLPRPPLHSPTFRSPKIETTMRKFEGNSKKEIAKVDLLSPQEVKELVKKSENNHRLNPILDRYENLYQGESQQLQQLAATIAARERHRCLSFTKTEKERKMVLEQSRARFHSSGNDEDNNKQDNDNDYNDAGPKKEVRHDEIRAFRYDFTDFVPPSYSKTESQRKLILEAVERSFVFAAFRIHGKARCEGAIDALIDAFEPMDAPPEHVLLHRGKKEENDQFYILEKGKVRFEEDGSCVSYIENVGEFFGEVALLHHAPSEVTVSTVLPTYSHGSGTETRLLKIKQKVFRGILHIHSQRAAQEKIDTALSVDFLHDSLEEDENLARHLSSIMVREELEIDEIFNVSQDTTFTVIKSGRVHATNSNGTHRSNSILNPGNYIGSRALIGSVNEQCTNADETCMLARSENVVFFRIDRQAMEQIIGASRLQNLRDMRRFATNQLVKKANLSNVAYDSMVNNITEKMFGGEQKQDTRMWKVKRDDPPAVYVVRQGSITVTSNDRMTGHKQEKELTAGDVFGHDQLELLTEKGNTAYKRIGELEASVSEGVVASIGVLSLDEGEVDIENSLVGSQSAIDNSVANSSNSMTPHLRAQVREVVHTNISLEDLERITMLGEGEFGEVWLVAADVFCAGNSEVRQKFALKTQLKVDDRRGNDAVNDILREVQIMKEVKHPQLADLVNTYEDETSIHMLMRLVPCGELWDRIHIEDDQGNWKSGLPEDHAKFYTMVVADTLDFMHCRGIIYRDLKPENILIDADGYPVIVDFGFAKFCPDKTYTFVGTANYVAPEIITNAGHNKCVDFWALGVTVYEMITGGNPFCCEGMDMITLYDTICREKHFPLPVDSNNVLVDFIDKLLEKDPIKRLGMLIGGIKDILHHPWFDGLDLEQIQTKQFPAPWKQKSSQVIDDGFAENELFNDSLTKYISTRETGEDEDNRTTVSSDSDSKSKDKKKKTKKITSGKKNINSAYSNPSEFQSNDESSVSVNDSLEKILSTREAGEDEDNRTTVSSDSKSKDKKKKIKKITSGKKNINSAYSNPSEFQSNDESSVSVNDSLENFLSTREAGEDEDNRTTVSSDSKSKDKKKKIKKITSGKKNINSIYSNPSEFQFVTPEFKFCPITNPKTPRRNLKQQKEKEIRRSLLKDSLLSFGIDDDEEN
jgi:protein kinase A